MAYYDALSPQPDFSFKFETNLSPTPNNLYDNTSTVNSAGADPVIVTDTIKTTGLTKCRSTTTANPKAVRYNNFVSSIADDNTAVRKITMECWVYFSSNTASMQLGQIQTSTIGRTITFSIQSARMRLDQAGSTGELTHSLQQTTVTPLAVNTWHHLAFVYDPTTQFKALYANGICYGYYYATGGNTWINPSPIGTASSFIESPWSASAQTYKVAAVNYYFDTILTQQQIMQRAVYGRTKLGLSNTILADNPVYFTQFDNADKTIDSSTLGTLGSTWGPPDDSATNITVNEIGVEDKSWKGASTFTTTATNAITFGSTFKDQFQDLQRSGNYTIEFFVKHSQTAAVNGGYFNALNGTTSLVSMSLGGFAQSLNGTTATGSNSTNGVQFGTLYGPVERIKNDGLWHHICLQITTTGTSFTGRLFFDGFLAFQNSGTWTQTSTTPDTPYTDVQLNRLTASSQNAAVSYDNFAIHSTPLTFAQIQSRLQDYYSLSSYGATVKYYDGTTWQTSSGQKVWNGTSWIDWDAYRWDGTSWVAI